MKPVYEEEEDTDEVAKMIGLKHKTYNKPAVPTGLDKQIRVKYAIAFGVLALLFICLLGYTVLGYEPTVPNSVVRPGEKIATVPVLLARWNETIDLNRPDTGTRPWEIKPAPTRTGRRFCYIIKDGWYRWCEGGGKESALYNGKGYKVLDENWLAVQMYGSQTQYDNANRWVMWIKDAKR